MIDGQPDSDSFALDALLTDFSEKCVGAKIKASAGFGDRHDAGTEEIAALGLAEEAGLSPDHIGSKCSLCGIVGEIKPRRFHKTPKHGLDL